MQIERKEKKKEIFFHQLHIGDVFMQAEHYFIRICADNYNENALDLESGDLVEFCNTEYIIPIKGRFIVEQ